MKLTWYLYLTLIFPITMFSQKHSKIKDEIQIEALIDSSYHYFSVRNLSQSAYFANEALKKSKEINYPQGIAYSYFYLGQSLFELGSYKESLNYLALAENQKYTAGNKFLQFEIHRVRGKVYGTMSLLESSIKEQKKALLILPSIKKTAAEKKYISSLVYDNLAYNYREKKQLDSSWYFLSKNKQILEEMDESFVFRNLLNLYSNLGIHYSNLEKFDSAQYYFSKSLKVAEKYDLNYKSFNYLSWGDMKMKTSQLDSALIYYEKALEDLEQSNFVHDMPHVYTKISIVYAALGNSDKSNHYKLKALEVDNLLKSEQLEASEIVLRDILTTNKKTFSSELNNKKILLYSLLIVVIFLIVSIAYIRKRSKSQFVKSKSLLKEKEKLISQKELNEQVLKLKVNESFDEIVSLAKTNSPEFWGRFQEVYPNFRVKLLQINPELKPSELILAAYTYLGFNTKDIAEYTFKAVQTIKNNKRNLRKRLNISTEENFSIWLRNYLEQ